MHGWANWNTCTCMVISGMGDLDGKEQQVTMTGEQSWQLLTTLNFKHSVDLLVIKMTWSKSSCN